MRIGILIFVLFLFGCASGPEPLNYGKDACTNCKMILMDKKFGAELLTIKGRVYKFDDINCMLRYVQMGQIEKNDIKQQLVVDFGSPGKLIEATKAYFVRSDVIMSPMGSHLAAFESVVERNKYAKSIAGVTMAWNDLIAP